MLLQAEAARRLHGQPSLHEAARDGHEKLVAIHLAANEHSVHIVVKDGPTELEYALCRSACIAKSSHQLTAFPQRLQSIH
jgi:hypothetical protein